MRIKLRYPDIDTFIQKYAVNISRGGIFIATKTPKPIGTLLRFEFVLASTEPGLSIIRGEGQVQWTREYDAATPTKAHGMGVKFTRLDAESQEIVDRALAWRSAQSAEAGEAVDPHADTRTPVAVATALPKSEPAPKASGDEPTAVRPISRINPAPTVTPPTAMATAPAPIFDAPTPIRTLRSDGTLAANGAHGGSESNGHAAVRSAELGATDAELEKLATSWGVSAERIARTLTRTRVTVASADEALAELEKLRTKPTTTTLPMAEALAELRRLLE